MIVGVVHLPSFSGDNAPGAAVRRTWCDDGVLAIIAARLVGKDSFTVLESRAVLAEGERPAGVDQGDGVMGFGRQVGVGDDGQIAGRAVAVGAV